MTAFAEHALWTQVASLYASAERKAREAAELIADRHALTIEVVNELGENDRSSTGFLAPPAFEVAADAFFAEPAQSYRGWETALQAQARIVFAVTDIVRAAPQGDVAIIAHGAVGTLYKCHLKGRAITRAEDQPRQGHFYAFERESGRLLCDWIAL